VDKLKAGDLIYGLRKGFITSKPVDKVGRKFFYVNREKFCLTKLTQVRDWGEHKQLYRTRAEAEAVTDRERIQTKLRQVCDWTNRRHICIDKLRRIEAILDEDPINEV